MAISAFALTSGTASASTWPTKKQRKKRKHQSRNQQRELQMDVHTNTSSHIVAWHKQAAFGRSLTIEAHQRAHSPSDVVLQQSCSYHTRSVWCNWCRPGAYLDARDDALVHVGQLRKHLRQVKRQASSAKVAPSSGMQKCEVIACSIQPTGASLCSTCAIHCCTQPVQMGVCMRVFRTSNG